MLEIGIFVIAGAILLTLIVSVGATQWRKRPKYPPPPPRSDLRKVQLDGRRKIQVIPRVSPEVKGPEKPRARRKFQRSGDPH